MESSLKFPSETPIVTITIDDDDDEEGEVSNKDKKRKIKPTGCIRRVKKNVSVNSEPEKVEISSFDEIDLLNPSKIPPNVPITQKDDAWVSRLVLSHVLNLKKVQLLQRDELRVSLIQLSEKLKSKRNNGQNARGVSKVNKK